MHSGSRLRPLENRSSPDRAACDRNAIHFPPTARRKTVCVKSLLRQHCFLHVQRARKRELITITTGTMPIIIITGTMPADTGTQALPMGSGSRTTLLDLGIQVLLKGIARAPLVGTGARPLPAGSPVTEGA